MKQNLHIKMSIMLNYLYIWYKVNWRFILLFLATLNVAILIWLAYLLISRSGSIMSVSIGTVIVMVFQIFLFETYAYGIKKEVSDEK